MSILYIDKSDCVIGKQDNRITVRYKDGMVRTIPVESIDGITLLGHAQVTTQCIQECLKKGISLSYYKENHTLCVWSKKTFRDGEKKTSNDIIKVAGNRKNYNQRRTLNER